MVHKNKIILFFVLNAIFLALISGCGGNGGSSQDFSFLFKQKAAAVFSESVAKNGFPGGVLGIMDETTGAVFLTATGMAEAQSITNLDQTKWTAKTPMATGMHFRIASVSKPFTAILTLMLVDQKLITLDQTIEDFFPGLVPNSATITIRNLLNMASGLYDHENYEPIDEYTRCGDLTQYFSPEEIIAASNAYSGGNVWFQPGEYYQYCNTNFTILAMIAQKVTGQSYKDLVTTMIIDRLGLSGTSVPGDSETEIPSPIAHGYDICDTTSQWKDYSIQNMSWDLGAGSLISTASDLLKMIKAIYTGELISPELKEQMFTPPAITNFDTGAPSNYGFGILNTDGSINHAGANPGYHTLMIYYKGYYFSILLNAGMNVTLTTPSGDEQKTTNVINVLSDVYNAITE